MLTLIKYHQCFFESVRIRLKGSQSRNLQESVGLDNGSEKLRTKKAYVFSSTSVLPRCLLWSQVAGD